MNSEIELKLLKEIEDLKKKISLLEGKVKILFPFINTVKSEILS